MTMATGHQAKSVLVIEDESEIRNFVFRVLELEGYHVLQAGDGIEGLRLAKANLGLSLILLDLRLPGRDGWVVLREIKGDAQTATIPVVVFSGVAAGEGTRNGRGQVPDQTT